MKKIRVVQIGMGHDHACPVLRAMLGIPEIEIVGVAEPNERFASRLQKPEFKDLPRFTVEELLDMEGLDAAVIETEEEYLTHYAQLFADKGLHVHIDKAGSIGYESFEKMVNTLREKKLIFHTGYMYRFNPLVMRARELVRSGELGRIYAVEAQMSVRIGREKKDWLGKFRGGMMYYLGCHDVDLVLSFMGGEPDEVIPLNATTGQDGAESEDYGFAVLRYGTGVSFVKTCAAEINGFARRQLVICGTKGTVSLNPIEELVEGAMQRSYGSLTVEREGMQSTSDCSERWETEEPFHRYAPMMTDFARLIIEGRENEFGYDYELGLFKTLMKCCDAE